MSLRPSSSPDPREAIADAGEVSLEDDLLYHLQQANVYSESKDHLSARAHLEQALAISPEHARTRNLLGNILFKLGHYEDAKKVFYALIDEHPNDVALFLNLATVAMRQGNLEEAEDSLQTLLQVEPKNERAHSHLGVIYRKLSRLEEARAHFLLAGSHDQAENVLNDLCDDSSVPEVSILSSIADDAIQMFEINERPFRAVDLEDEEPEVRDGRSWENFISHFPKKSESDGRFDDVTNVDSQENLLDQKLATPIGIAEELLPEPSISDTMDLDTQSLIPISDDEPGPQFEPVIQSHVTQTGFQTPEQPGSDAWLYVEGSAFIRSSILVAATGGLEIGKSEVPATSNLFLKVAGNGKCLVRVPHVVAAVRDVHWMSVRASALAGFEGELAWHRTDALGTAVMELKGTGSVLLNSPQRAIIAKVDPQSPLHIRKDMFLAWSRDVAIKEADLPGVAAQHVTFEGQGMVILAGSNLV